MKLVKFLRERVSDFYFKKKEDICVLQLQIVSFLHFSKLVKFLITSFQLLHRQEEDINVLQLQQEVFNFYFNNKSSTSTERNLYSYKWAKFLHRQS